jgi:hypothetical protein
LLDRLEVQSAPVAYREWPVSAQQGVDLVHRDSAGALIGIEDGYPAVSKIVPIVRDVDAEHHGAALRPPRQKRGVAMRVPRREDQAHGGTASDVKIALDNLDRIVAYRFIKRREVPAVVWAGTEHGRRGIRL